MPAPLTSRRQLLLGGLATIASASVLPWTSVRAEDFPTKPIRLVVPYGAGGPTDNFIRVLAHQLSTGLGQPMLVENKPGANGTFGAAELARAKPDGYTIAVLPASVFREPWLNRVPFDPLKLTYVIGLTDYTFGLAVKADAPWKTWAEFLDQARKQPGKLSVGAAGPIQTPSIVLSELGQMTGTELNRVSYKGDAEQATDLLGGHIDAGILSGVASPYIQSGRLRYLAMLTPERVPQFPDVPTLRELGVDAVVESPYGIGAPGGLPADRLKILHDAFKTALESAESSKSLDQLNQPVNYRSPEAFTAYATETFAREKVRLEKFKVAPNAKP